MRFAQPAYYMLEAQPSVPQDVVELQIMPISLYSYVKEMAISAQ